MISFSSFLQIIWLYYYFLFNNFIFWERHTWASTSFLSLHILSHSLSQSLLFFFPNLYSLFKLLLLQYTYVYIHIHIFIYTLICTCIYNLLHSFRFAPIMYPGLTIGDQIICGNLSLKDTNSPCLSRGKSPAALYLGVRPCGIPPLVILAC